MLSHAAICMTPLVLPPLPLQLLLDLHYLLHDPLHLAHQCKSCLLHKVGLFFMTLFFFKALRIFHKLLEHLTVQLLHF